MILQREVVPAPRLRDRIHPALMGSLAGQTAGWIAVLAGLDWGAVAITLGISVPVYHWLQRARQKRLAAFQSPCKPLPALR